MIYAQESLVDISIHAPREGGDYWHPQCRARPLRFQSTPPARGATLEKSADPHIHLPFQSTPPARGATSPSSPGRVVHSLFQSTPPARGATERHEHPALVFRHFNPRPPRGGRLGSVRAKHHRRIISIHAPREGGDFIAAALIFSDGISIHAPREGGDQASALAVFDVLIISIHAPREGGDFTTSILR